MGQYAIACVNMQYKLQNERSIYGFFNVQYILQNISTETRDAAIRLWFFLYC